MALRLMQIVVPEVDRLDLESLLEGHEPVSCWQQARSGDRIAINLVLEAGEAEPILDRVEKRFSRVKGFRVLLYPLEAVLPRPEEEAAAPVGEAEEPERPRKFARVSSEELFHNVTESLGAWNVHATMTALSVFVAAIGLLRDSLAMIIAAMVIAPLLGPNIALALATTLGEGKLAVVALRRAGFGLLIGLSLSVAIGLVPGVAGVDVESLLEIPAIAERTQVFPSDVALALASGVAGALAFTTGASATLIGVMVAVALMPPLVAFGMLVGARELAAAGNAALLLATNVVCINVAAIATFLMQGIRPREWWQAVRAGQAARRSLIGWFAVLAALTGWVLYSKYASLAALP